MALGGDLSDQIRPDQPCADASGIPADWCGMVRYGVWCVVCGRRMWVAGVVWLVRCQTSSVGAAGVPRTASQLRRAQLYTADSSVGATGVRMSGNSGPASYDDVLLAFSISIERLQAPTRQADTPKPSEYLADDSWITEPRNIRYRGSLPALQTYLFGLSRRGCLRRWVVYAWRCSR